MFLAVRKMRFIFVFINFTAYPYIENLAIAIISTFAVQAIII